MLIPFLEEDSLNELSHTYGKQLRTLYGLLMRYPHAFERLMHLLAEPLFSKNAMRFVGVMPAIKAVIARRSLLTTPKRRNPVRIGNLSINGVTMPTSDR